LSVSAKLADYDETKELLSRLRVKELRKLAQQNGIALEKGDSLGKVKPVGTKEKIIDLLVDSDFKEYSLIGLLGLSRLTKEELLNHMKVTQLKGLAKETGILLEKTSIFGTKKAIKKEDIVDVLKALSVPKIRDYAKRILLIKKPSKKKARTRKRVKKAAKKPTRKVRRKEKAKMRVKQPTKRLIQKPVRKEYEKIIDVKPAAMLRKTKREVRIIEEAIREKVTEREIIRRRVSPRKSEEEAERIEKMKPEKIKAIVKKAKKK
jgi:hypothetical protein